MNNLSNSQVLFTSRLNIRLVQKGIKNMGSTMQFKENNEASADYLRKAIPLMIGKKIPPTPNNYALWYAHVTADHKELSESLLSTFPTPESYSHEKSEKLFFEHFIKHHLPESDTTQTSVVALLSQLLGVVNENANNTHDYGAALKNAMITIQSSNDQNEVNAALTLLLNQTQEMEGKSREFQTDLLHARQEVEALKKALEASKKDALVDELTQIANRRAFDQTIDKALANPVQTPVLLLLDLDHFKLCNDTYGHVMGDRVLQQMGKILTEFGRDSVHVSRYGGEEFAVIIDDTIDNAIVIAESMRDKVSRFRITQNESSTALGSITVSIGIAQARVHEDVKTLKERTDEALYQAKKNGRNQVCVSGSSD
ncbi:MAG: diguanylate cyclase [Gammaproteobacteria bacterium]